MLYRRSRLSKKIEKSIQYLVSEEHIETPEIVEYPTTIILENKKIAQVKNLCEKTDQ